MKKLLCLLALNFLVVLQAQANCGYRRDPLGACPNNKIEKAKESFSREFIRNAEDTIINGEKITEIESYTEQKQLALYPNELDIKVTKNNLLCGRRLKLQASELAPYLKGEHENMRFKTSVMEQGCFYRNYILDNVVDENDEIKSQIEITYEQSTFPITRCDRACSFCSPTICRTVGHRTEKQEVVRITFYGITFYSREVIDTINH